MMGVTVKSGIIFADYRLIGKALILLGWGKRRVSSRATSGTSAYPRTVSAHWRLWVTWVWDAQVKHRRREYVVISGDPEGGHGARYAKELADKRVAAEAVARKADMALRIDQLQAERAAARAARDFAKADAIRDEIEAAGFVVNDAGLGDINSHNQEPKA